MASKISITPAESSIVDQIFAKNDSQGFGVITGDVAVTVFSGSKLPSTTLGEIWSIADADNKGFLDKNGVGVAIRLIGHAQAGKAVSDSLIAQPGPLPSIEGYGTSAPPTTRSPAPKPPVTRGLPPLTPLDKAKFVRLFQGTGPINGLLPGDKARDVFIKSKLPVDKLSQIWALSDTKSRGALDQTDFIIAMYMIQALMADVLTFVPTTLPPGLYEQASGDSSVHSGVVAHATGGSGSYSPSISGSFPGRASSTLQPQYTGPSLQPQVTGSSLRTQPSNIAQRAHSAFISPFSTPDSQAWDVTPAEKASADKFFDSLDTQKRGFIEGDAAVSFFLLSKLSSDHLAQVWDLADYNNDGRLTRDGFAIAMHLIQGKLAGKDIPPTLPPTLVPPSLRASGITAPAAQAPLAPVHELSDLLFDDVEPSTKSTSPSLQPQPTGSIFSSPPVQAQQTGLATGAAVQPQSTGAFTSPPLQQQGTGHQPSQPQRQATGFTASPFVTQPVSQDPFGSTFGATPGKNLLDDDESTATSPPIADKSIEIGNLQNQIHSTNRSLEISKSERQEVEARVADQAAQLSALQTQLETAKATYETETKLLAQLRERFSNQSAEITKTRQELIRAESDLSAARVEKAEVEQGVLRDKEEVRDLQRKMAETGTAIETTKVDIERARKEAKQQKGLLAIAKKQLAAREAERTKVEKELEGANEEASRAAHEREEAEATLARDESVLSTIGNGHPDRVSSPSTDSTTFAAAQPLPGTPSSISQKSTNPFDRLVSTQVTGGSVRAESPFLPFASASLPSSPPTEPTTTSAAPSTDPFGFGQAFSHEPVKPSNDVDVAKPTDVSTLHGSSSDIGFGQEVNSPTSEADLFSTPPTKPGEGSLPSAINAEFATTRFPPLDEATPTVAFEPVEHKPDTDLGSRLKELDVDDSDSSSDEDDKPLATLVPNATERPFPATVTSEPDTAPTTESASTLHNTAFPNNVNTSETPAIHENGIVTTQAVTSSFDQAFSTPAATLPALAVQNETENVGKSAFDEAFSKMTPSPHTQQTFGFDDGFGDTFDFASTAPVEQTTTTTQTNLATVSSNANTGFFPPPPNGTARHSMLPPQAEHNTIGSQPKTQPTVAQPVERKDSNPFSQPSNWVPVSTTSNAQKPTSDSSPPTQAPNLDLNISFDDAFGSVGASKALALDNFGSTSSRGSATQPTGDSAAAPPPATSPITTAPITASPTSSRNGALRNSISSPPRGSTPPPRVSSPTPRPRTSTGSFGKDVERVEKKETRSKLSIRLPFGKKRKSQAQVLNSSPEAPPLPLSQQRVSHLATVPDELVPPATTTQAVDDDVEPVKQLCGLGFSRTQAVAALESNGYDFQRALNSLLGSQ